jgi:hypothetical protein
VGFSPLFGVRHLNALRIAFMFRENGYNDGVALSPAIPKGQHLPRSDNHELESTFVKSNFI